MTSRRSTRISLLVLLSAACAYVAAGCSPRVSREELGTVVFDAKDLPGAGKPYDHPEMHPPGSKAAPEGASTTPAESSPAPAAAADSSPPAEIPANSPEQQLK